MHTSKICIFYWCAFVGSLHKSLHKSKYSSTVRIWKLSSSLTPRSKKQIIYKKIQKIFYQRAFVGSLHKCKQSSNAQI